MTDWNKLKVVDLKAELKARGLPQTGLKPALVARLAEAESGDGSESEATVQGDVAKLDTASPEAAPSSLPTSDLNTDIPTPSTTIPAPPAFPKETDVIESPVSQAQSEAPPLQPPTQLPETQNDLKDASLPLAESQEVLGDLQKRKRRSQSPVPTSEDIAHKRARQDVMMSDGVVTAQADSAWVEEHNGVDVAGINGEAKKDAPAGDSAEPGPTIVDTAMEGVVVEDVPGPDQDASMTTEGDPKHSLDESQSRVRDSRFKGLFSAPQAPTTEPVKSEDAEMPDAEPDRAISPAIHPATAAIYIRDIMRPLNPVQLKTHLAALATPPGEEVSEDIIVDFYLDPIRTHAFVSFGNISAASRLRSALHDRIWPDERNRKPLWIDFVPLEKAEEWIKEEELSKPGGRGVAKKWEVVYDVDHDRNVTAFLQEVGSISSRPQTARQTSITSTSQAPFAEPSLVQPRGIEEAPLGPRADTILPPASGIPEQELDQLFAHTKALPKLYYQPVDKAIANKRLDRLEDGMAKGYDYNSTSPQGEVNRYTFEDDELVDRGPELFPGIRPPRGFRGPTFDGGRPRGGGGGGGGFGSRGGRGYGAGSRGYPPRDGYRGPGGYRGESYQGGGDRRYRDDRRY